MDAHINSFINNMGRKIEPDVRHHLAKVYSCLTGTTAAATLGALLHLNGIWETGMMSIVGTLICVIALQMIADNGKNFYMRLGLLLGFGLCSGQSLGPLLEHVIAVNPSIVVTALAGTTVVFVSFSLSAMLAERGQYLFLGGLLFSVINALTIASLANIFFQSPFIYQTQLYGGLIAMSAFILYDTQAIMEKCRRGNRDCVGHAMELFFDVVSVFRRLLVILTQKEQRDQRKRKN